MRCFPHGPKGIRIPAYDRLSAAEIVKVAFLLMVADPILDGSASCPSPVMLQGVHSQGGKSPRAPFSPGTLTRGYCVRPDRVMTFARPSQSSCG